MWSEQARPNEFLVVARHGRLFNLGLGARGLRWPGRSFARVPSGKYEADFALTQETRDGIPLRFKGIVIYRVVEPERAARLFDFAGGRGHEQIQSLLAHLCMGELRAVVAGLTMRECIEGRKTTLTQAVAAELGRLARGERGPEDDWGIELDAVQVAQVFLIDEELRRQLEAEVRDRIRTTSERSRIQTERELKLMQIATQREVEEAGMETDRQRAGLESEKLRLRVELEREQVEAEAPVRLLRQQRQAEALEQERELRQRENAALALRVEGEMLKRRAEHELAKEMRALELPADIAEALGGLFQNAQLTQVGAGSDPLSLVAPLFSALTRRVSPVPVEPEGSLASDGGKCET